MRIDYIEYIYYIDCDDNINIGSGYVIDKRQPLISKTSVTILPQHNPILHLISLILTPKIPHPHPPALPVPTTHLTKTTQHNLTKQKRTQSPPTHRQ